MEDSERNDMTHRLSSSTGTSSSSLPRSANRIDLPFFTSSSSLPRGHYRNFPPPSFSPETGKRSGIPPAHPNIPPHSPYFPAAASRSPPPAANGFSPHHSRSISQPPFFSLDSLPPFSDSASPSDAPTAEAAPPLARTSSGRSAGDGLPPRKAHRRSQSDIPFGFLSPASPHITPQGFGSAARQSVKQESDRLSSDGGGGRKSDGDPVSDDLVSAYMNLDSLDTLNSSEDQRASSENEAESSSIFENSEFKEGHKRSATQDPIPGHSRSLSIDSFVGKLNLGDESLKLPPSPANPIGAQHSRSASMDGMLSTFSLEFGNGEFNASELKKIMANEKLAEVALADPKRAKRILANRLSAARSKERKMKYISELEHKVQTLQTEATTLSAQLTMLQRESSGLTNQNNELKFRLQAMEQQAQLRDALNEALTSEVQRLKLATGESGEADLSNSLNQQIQLNPQMFQLQQFQQQQQQQQQSVQFSLYQLQAQHQRNNSSIKNQSSE